MHIQAAGSRATARRLAAAASAALAVTVIAAVAPGGMAARAAVGSDPAITVADGNSVIAVTTSEGGLRFCWNEHGSTDTWHGEQVAPDNTNFS
jgi:hypothetical protein